MLTSGTLPGLPSMTWFPSTLCAHGMVGPCLNSTYATQQTCNIMQSTNVSGVSLTHARAFTIPCYLAIPTLFAHPIRPMFMLFTTIFCLFGNGSIVHILIHTFPAHSSLPPFADAKHVILSLRMIGTGILDKRSWIVRLLLAPPPFLYIKETIWHPLGTNDILQN